MFYCRYIIKMTFQFSITDFWCLAIEIIYTCTEIFLCVCIYDGCILSYGARKVHEPRTKATKAYIPSRGARCFWRKCEERRRERHVPWWPEYDDASHVPIELEIRCTHMPVGITYTIWCGKQRKGGDDLIGSSVHCVRCTARGAHCIGCVPYLTQYAVMKEGY